MSRFRVYKGLGFVYGFRQKVLSPSRLEGSSVAGGLEVLRGRSAWSLERLENPTCRATRIDSELQLADKVAKP